MVDWKWEYMEGLFSALSPLICEFLRTFDAAKIKAPVGHSDEQALSEGIDPKCISKIAGIKGDWRRLSALCEAYRVFCKAAGREARWFTGCSCHDHIWTSDKSQKQKLKLFRQTLQPPSQAATACIWQGRRASDLARGYWRTMLTRMQVASSNELHRRLTMLRPEPRAAVLLVFQSMRTAWVEEIGAKFAYWGELPHLCLGMWPSDIHGQDVAKQVVAKAVAVPVDARVHRVTHRLLFDKDPNFGDMVRAFAENGDMAPELANELQEANMVSTVEQQVEGIHARIQKNNKRGMSEPPANSAHVRLPQHLKLLADWRVQLFVVQAWVHTKNMAKHLLPFTVDTHKKTLAYGSGTKPLEFVQRVYHMHPKQLFSELSREKAAHGTLRALMNPAPAKAPETVRMLVDFLKDRFSVGTVFSLPPCAVPAAEVTALVPIGEAHPPKLAANTVVEQCLALARLPVPPEVQIGYKFKDHKFYRVIKASLTRRFLQHSEIQKEACIGVMELVLGGRNDDGSGVFGESPTGIRHLNLLQCLETSGVEGLLAGSVIWPETVSAMLTLRLPGAGRHTHGMLPLSAIENSSQSAPLDASKTGEASRGWEETLGQIMVWLGCEDEECYLDLVAGQIRSLDGSRSFEVSIQVLTDLVSAGVLYGEATEFDELKVRVNHEAVSWCSTMAVKHGRMGLTSHIRLDRPAQHPKLMLMMHLSAEGWKPLVGKEKDPHHTLDAEKLFVASHNRPKSYFAVFCVIDRVLQKLAVVEGTLPIVYHHMPDTYYRLLMCLDNTKSVQALTDMLERAADVTRLTDKAFQALLPEVVGADTWVDDEEEPDPASCGLLHLKDKFPGPSGGKDRHEDIKRAHRIALQVLKGIPADMVDIRCRWVSRKAGMDEVRVNFDNCSHSSGRQRAYVACPNKRHVACFRYTTVDLHTSPAHAAAYLLCWAEHARGKPALFSKQSHKDYEPSAAEWGRLLPDMVEEA